MNRKLRYATVTRSPLGANAMHRFAASYALSVYVPDAVYTFIPKNGCSTMRLTLAIANGVISDPADFNWIHANNGTFSASLQQLITAKYTFVILRCPFSRLASCYLDKIVGRYPPFWILDDAMGRKVDPNRFTFRAFVKALTDPNLLMLDEHWCPQTNFLVYDAYDDVFDLANFGQATATLREKIGLQVHDARGLTGHGIDGLRRVSGFGPDTSPLEILNLRDKGDVPEPRSLYDDDLIATVRQLYRGDLELYGNHFPASVMFPDEPATA